MDSVACPFSLQTLINAISRLLYSVAKPGRFGR